MKRLSIVVFLLWSVTVSAENNTNVIFETELGAIEIELFVDQAPASTESVLKLVDQGLYDGEGFYRVVRPDNDNGNPVISVIQGGVLDPLEAQAVELVEHETTDRTGIKHLDGVVSLARTGASGSGATFFICIGDQSSLDFGGARNADGQGFAAFGRVTSGMDVVRSVNRLTETRADPNPYVQNQILLNPIKIIRAYRK